MSYSRLQHFGANHILGFLYDAAAATPDAAIDILPYSCHRALSTSGKLRKETVRRGYHVTGS